ncbi:hypothetical protein NMT31_003669 [Vibrio cholerae]|nr:hypothetical protein [Vibrio cholerae]EJL6968188.1 hypothetical protein [Vibrio cholerae]EKG0035544.1 hypothetical protein [Vibrio cholerae]
MKIIAVVIAVVIAGSLLGANGAIAQNNSAIPLGKKNESTNWFKLKKEGWSSGDNYSDEKMIPAVGTKGSILNDYPWTNYLLIQANYQSSYYLGDKKSKTLKILKIKTRSGYNDVDLKAFYQGMDEGQGCYIAFIDDATSFNSSLSRQPGDPEVEPQLVMKIPENCINQREAAALIKQKKEEHKKIMEALQKITLEAECRRLGKC